MSPQPWLSQGFDGRVQHSLYRARWIDAAGNKTEWSRPKVVGEYVYDQGAQTQALLKMVSTGLLPLMACFLASALLYLRSEPKHRSPVGLRRPISPGPR